MAVMSLEKGRWYYVKIFDRELREPTYYFIGQLREEKDHCALYQDQDGRWYLAQLEDLERYGSDGIIVHNAWVWMEENLEDFQSEGFREFVKEALGGKWPEIIRIPQRE